MSHVEVTDTNGKVWVGDPTEEPLSASERDALHELLGDLKSLQHLSLDVDGIKVYLNPSFIVAVAVHE